MTFTRNFPHAEYYTDAAGKTVRNDNLNIDLRRGDDSHPVFEDTQTPDWAAFRDVDQLRDVLAVYSYSWEAVQRGTQTAAQQDRYLEITGAGIAMAVNAMGPAREDEALALLRLNRSCPFRPGVAELCTKALEVWNKVLEAEARFAAAAS